jgi:hypothetical protein
MHLSRDPNGVRTGGYRSVCGHRQKLHVILVEH